MAYFEKLSAILSAYPSLRILFILVAVAFIITLIGKLFRAAVVMVILFLLISVASTVLLGDGTAYVNGVTQFVSDEYRGKIEEAYQEYRERETSDPVFNYDAIQDTLDTTKENAKKAAKNKAIDLAEEALENARDS